jgi:hypothetical protein
MAALLAASATAATAANIILRIVLSPLSLTPASPTSQNEDHAHEMSLDCALQKARAAALTTT